MSDALQRLIHAVEINSVNWYGWTEREDALPGNLWEVAREADVNGSLDAARALHDALLPGYTRDVDATAPECGITVSIWSPKGPIVGRGDELSEARAWLLAILRAYQQVQQ